MPITSLELLVDYNNERLNALRLAFVKAQNRPEAVSPALFDEALTKEQAFINLLQQLANTPVLLKLLPQIILDQTQEEAIRGWAVVVGFAQADQAAIDEIGRLVYLEDHIPTTLWAGYLNVLPEANKKALLNFYTRHHEHRFCRSAAVEMTRLYGYPSAQLAWWPEMLPAERRDADFLRALYWTNPTSPEVLHTLIDTYKTITTNHKTLAYERTELLLPILKEALAFVRTPEGMLCEFSYGPEIGLRFTALFGGPSDLEHIKHLFTLPLESSQRAKASDVLKLYGNPEALDWYYEQLGKEEFWVAWRFHLAMLNFFYPVEQHGATVPERLEEDWRSFKKSAPSDGGERLQRWWKPRLRWAKSQLKMELRYLDSQPFDLIQYFLDHQYIADRDELGIVLENIYTYTGQRFFFDPNGLLSDQLKQMDRANHYLLTHKDHFPVGGWFYQGSFIE